MLDPRSYDRSDVLATIGSPVQSPLIGKSEQTAVGIANWKAPDRSAPGRNHRIEVIPAGTRTARNTPQDRRKRLSAGADACRLSALLRLPRPARGADLRLHRHLPLHCDGELLGAIQSARCKRVRRRERVPSTEEHKIAGRAGGERGGRDADLNPQL
jgi:hypothetical protein